MRKNIFALLTLLLLTVSAIAEEALKPVVYVTSWCGYCRKLEKFLKEQGIDYVRHDVEKDSAAAEEFSRLGGEGIPLVTIGKDVIHGYDPERILEVLQR